MSQNTLKAWRTRLKEVQKTHPNASLICDEDVVPLRKIYRISIPKDNNIDCVFEGCNYVTENKDEIRNHYRIVHQITKKRWIEGLVK